MTRTTLRPMGVGPMLDRSFQVYRKLFTPLFLVTLLAFGPFYLMSNLLVVNLSALPIVPELRFDDPDRFWLSRFPDNWLEGGLALWVKITGVTLLTLGLLFVAVPLYFAWGVILINRALNGETPAIRSTLREAWKRYGRVLGNSLLFWLITIGAYIGVTMVNGMLTVVYGGVVLSSAALADSDAVEAIASAAFLSIYVVIAYGGTLVYYYFTIRFGYFLPPLLFEDEGVGIGRSWSLTRKSFWRLFGVYLNFGALTYVFAVALGIVFAGLGVSLSGLLLILVVLCAFIPAGLVVYTVTYRVQKVRTDADDVEALLLRLGGSKLAAAADAVEAEGAGS